MEPDKDQIINVAIGDPSLIENIIDRVNKTYKTQLKEEVQRSMRFFCWDFITVAT
jgi:hypothetical protein